ncbi:hypothetical protein NECAME_12740 [Necator americanus]|uniref:HAD superfamily hydrolase, 5'-nucleotidase n=1 Tax=Necator americanus TaxID=51031 RepID=W2SZP8_NECAM|nr:hypothetical protein NECAME_12740 [Necator americanus]ETN74754.1 hypothetical protein NECAME_12740 [Necator americanus]
MFSLLRRTSVALSLLNPRRYLHAQSLTRIYELAREACANVSVVPRVDPRAVFVNNELDLGSIDVYGFDYDYTLAVYTRDLNELIYDLALRRLISQFKECVKQVHVSGEMYQKVSENLEVYIHRNEGLKNYLELLQSSGKELFVVTNSPFTFMNVLNKYTLAEKCIKKFPRIWRSISIEMKG